MIQIVVLLCVIAPGCGGGGGGGGTQPAPAKRAARSDVARPLRVDVQGRTLRGECTGKAGPGRPTIVLAAGQGNDEHQLDAIASELAQAGLVCGYARAGIGGSDPPARTPPHMSDEIDDLRALLEQGRIPKPYLLVGQSLGGSLALMYAQRNPADLAGVVAMNPGPTYHDWLRRIRGSVTRTELIENEVKPLSGRGGDEPVDTRETDQLLADGMPAGLPYVVMYAEDCGGGADAYCLKVVKQLEQAHRALARLSSDGRFVAVKGAGHEIFRTDLPAVLAAIRAVMARARG
jgi:pimeloyl-ACP methyl ester carboxylesterase